MIVLDRTAIRMSSYRGWKLRNMQWNNIDFFGVDFHSAVLTGAVFRNCTFENTLFCEADLTGATFECCVFKEVDFESAAFGMTTLIDCVFTQVYMVFMRFEHATLTNVTFIDSQVLRPSFRNSTFTSVSFVGGNLSDARFVDGTIIDLVFRDVSASDLLFIHTTLRRVKFEDETHLRCVVFDACALSNITHTPGMAWTDVRFDSCTRRNVQFPASERKRRCKVCGELRLANQFVGKVKACNKCKEMGNYSDTNSKRLGRTSALPCFSFEFEVELFDRKDAAEQARNSERDCDEDDEEDDYHTVEADGELRYDTEYNPNHEETDMLLLHNFLKTQDGTVSEEWKSPIYLSMGSFTRVAPLLDTLARDGCVGAGCGTHIHVECAPDARQRLSDHFNSIMGPTVERMIRKEQETRKFWGRYFTDYAGHRYERGGRYTWCNINTHGTPTVEFRLAKYHDSDQFTILINFVRRLVKYLERELSDARSPEGYRRISSRVLAMYENAVES